jgi:uncharacterized protein YodC (DUF2158 family)
MADALKPGDTVKLKSGGPVMTVVRVEEGHCTAMWFSGDEVYSNSFPKSHSIRRNLV